MLIDALTSLKTEINSDFVGKPRRSRGQRFWKIPRTVKSRCVRWGPYGTFRVRGTKYIFIEVGGNGGRAPSWMLLRWSDDRACCRWGDSRLREGRDDLGLLWLLRVLFLYTSLFGAITASVSCLNFRLVSSWLGFALISSSGACSWNDLRTQRQPHDQQRLLFPFLSRCAGPSAA